MPRGDSPCLSPFTTRVAPKAKYKIYISGGGPPRGGGRRRGQSTAVWLTRPTENFTSISPFEGPMNIFTSAPPIQAEAQKDKKKNGRSSPLSRGEATVHYPLRGRDRFYLQVHFKVQTKTNSLKGQHGGYPCYVFYQDSATMLVAYRRPGRRVSPGHWT